MNRETDLWRQAVQVVQAVIEAQMVAEVQTVVAEVQTVVAEVQTVVAEVQAVVAEVQTVAEVQAVAEVYLVRGKEAEVGGERGK